MEEKTAAGMYALVSEISVETAAQKRQSVKWVLWSEQGTLRLVTKWNGNTVRSLDLL